MHYRRTNSTSHTTNGDTVKRQSERAQSIRARRAEREQRHGTCPEHGHKVNRHTKYNQAIRFLCGCPTGQRRN